MLSKSKSTTESRGPRPRLGKWLLSLVLIFHCAAVLTPPLAMQTQGPLGSSPSVASLMRIVQPYSQFLYLDRGYAFFAPDPGPSHLFQAATTQPDGSVQETMYPDRQHHRPRLLYHRHFMLAEFLTEIHQPPGPPRDLIETDRQQAEDWARARARYEHVRLSIVEHLQSRSSGKPVAIRRIEHLIPTFVEFNNGEISLTDQPFYRVLLDRPMTVAPSQELPQGAPETIPPPKAEMDPSKAEEAPGQADEANEHSDDPSSPAVSP